MPESTPKVIGGVSGIGPGASAAPSATPPPRKAAAIGGAGAGTVWNNSQLVNALWSINEDRNSWVGIQGTGWVKLSTNSDTGIVALTMLAAHAKQLQTIVNYRVEDDGMIHEIYAW
jgi:hypothetical protein